MKKNRIIMMLIASIVTLLPIVAGLILWSRLPDKMPIHWGVNGEVDGFAGKGFAVFFLPSFMLAMHWICVFLSFSIDKKNKEQNKHMEKIIIWMIPIISVFVNTAVYFAALGKQLNMTTLLPILCGILFIVIGNFMPKIRQNRTLGIKIKWTLENEENWNMTHRFAGKVWFFGGIVILFSAFLPTFLIWTFFISSTFVLVFAPIIYSGIYCMKQKKETEK